MVVERQLEAFERPPRTLLDILIIEYICTEFIARV